MVEVVLLPGQVWIAQRIGESRQLESIFPPSGVPPRANKAGRPIDSVSELQDNILGAAGEIAVAQFLGFPWDWTPSVNANPRDGDVGPFQVRTGWTPNGHLIIRDRDRPGIYVSATLTRRVDLVSYDGSLPILLHGWMTADEVRALPKVTLAANRPPAWGAPRNQLHPMDTLPHD